MLEDIKRELDSEFGITVHDDNESCEVCKMPYMYED